MRATNYDILDLVAVTVGNIRSGSFSDHDIASDVVLDGNNIFISGKPVSIANIKTTKHSVREFVKLIRESM